MFILGCYYLYENMKNLRLYINAFVLNNVECIYSMGLYNKYSDDIMLGNMCYVRSREDIL